MKKELIYEALKAVQARVGNVDEGQREIRWDMGAVRGNRQAVQTRMSAMQLDMTNLGGAFGLPDTRLPGSSGGSTSSTRPQARAHDSHALR